MNLRPWLLVGTAALATLAIGTASWVYIASELHLRSFETPPATFAVPGDAVTIARGDHLVRTRGCRGCHGEDFEGQTMWGNAVAPNLAEYARRYEIATFEAALRHGIAHDGKAMYSMPSYGFRHLRDADVAAIFAYLRVQPVKRVALPTARLPWSVRFAIARGEDSATPGFLAQVPALRHVNDANPRLARGEYFAMTTCNECHGFGLRADQPFGGVAPDLIVVAGYDEAAFTRLLRTGIALGDRELPRMSGVARRRFATLS